MPRSKGKRGAELTEEQEAEYLQFHQNVQAIADRWEKDANGTSMQGGLWTIEGWRKGWDVVDRGLWKQQIERYRLNALEYVSVEGRRFPTDIFDPEFVEYPSR